MATRRAKAKADLAAMRAEPRFQAACALQEVQISVENAWQSLRKGEHPNRVADYVRDIARWAKHAESHLADAARAPGEPSADRDAVCNRVGCNVHGRVAKFLERVEGGNDDAARGELLALLKFFPKR